MDFESLVGKYLRLRGELTKSLHRQSAYVDRLVSPKCWANSRR